MEEFLGDIIEAEFQLQIDDGSLREVNLFVKSPLISCMKFGANNNYIESPNEFPLAHISILGPDY